jgi:hypothetical protein
MFTPFIWKRLTGRLEKVGWTSGIIVALFTLLPISMKDIPYSWNFVPIIVAGIILGFTACFSDLRKRFKMHFQWPITLHKADRIPSHRTTKTSISTLPPVSMYSSHQLSWNELFALTNNEICIQGITLESLNHVRPTIENALQQNKKIKLLYCNKDTQLMPKIEKLVVSTGTAIRIRSAIDMANDIRDALGNDHTARSNFEMRWHDEIPTMSLVIVDPRSDAGSIQIEPYPYKTPQGDRKLFIIKQVEHPEIFGAYRGAFDKLWNDAHTAS